MSDNSLLDTLLKYIKDNMATGADSNMERKPTEGEDSGRVMSPEVMEIQRNINRDPTNITNDQGQIVGNDNWNWKKDGNPFEHLLQPGGNGPGTISGFVSRLLGHTPERNNPGPSLVPGTGVEGRPEELLSTPSKMQKQRGLGRTQPMETPELQPTPPDYSMPAALDPNAIEELRKSLLTGAGQWDPSNPNGLAGRMSSPNAAVDQRSQMNQSQNMVDDLRGFDGSRGQRIKDFNQQGQIEAGNVNLANRPQVHNADGSTSTVRTIGITTDRGYVNIPTVSDDGRVLSDQEAIQQYKTTGRHLGIYRDQASGDAAAKSLHNEQARRYGL